jgi:hypothetical protein
VAGEGEAVRYFAIVLACWIALPYALRAESADQPGPAEDASVKYAETKVAKDGVEFALKIRSDNVAGEPVMLHIRVTNRRDAPIGLPYDWDSYGDWFFIFVTKKPGEEKVAFTTLQSRQGWGHGASHELLPSQKYSVDLNLALLYDLTLSGAYSARVKKLVVLQDVSKARFGDGVLFEGGEVEFNVKKAVESRSMELLPEYREEILRKIREGTEKERTEAMEVARLAMDQRLTEELREVARSEKGGVGSAQGRYRLPNGEVFRRGAHFPPSP